MVIKDVTKDPGSIWYGHELAYEVMRESLAELRRSGKSPNDIGCELRRVADVVQSAARLARAVADIVERVPPDRLKIYAAVMGIEWPPLPPAPPPCEKHGRAYCCQGLPTDPVPVGDPRGSA